MLGSVIPTMAFAVAEDTQEHISESKNVLESILNDIKAFIQSILDFFRRLFGCEPDPIPVAEVTADKTYLDLIIGDTDKITATVLPADATNQKLRFSSSDEAVVTVDYQGNVVAVGVGKAVITITSKDDETKTFAIQVRVEKPDPEGYTPVTTVDELKAAIEAGTALIVIKEDLAITESIVIPENADITIHAKGKTLKRAEGAEAVAMFTAKSGSKLTLTEVVVDGGAVWTGDIDPVLLRGTTNSGLTASGAIIATEANSAIVLNEGAVLQNNDGANAVFLGTRIGASLIVNGGEIINNSSGAGAIWGGGHITINSGKINSNSSTGPAGAIRMVSSCNLTMNGGEINNNKAETIGGAIYGYGASTYNFNGGEIANNSATTGGAIYTGDSSVFNISGDFELHGNKDKDGGAIRFTNYTTLNMTGGKIYDNLCEGNKNFNAFYGWNLAANIKGGEIADDFTIDSGLYSTFGAADITGVVHFALATTHNTAILTADFRGFKFTVAEGANFANFNLKPADDYVYTEGDEAKLICLNEGYVTYWNAAEGTFRLMAI